MTAQASPDSAILAWYRRLVPLNTAPGSWIEQTDYEGGWKTIKNRELDDDDLARMLRLEVWLGCRAPQQGRADRISIDLDCVSPDGLEYRDTRYRLIRQVFGTESVPLVFLTPSGFGLRVVYRIPEVPLEEVITGFRSGLVADVLRGHGLEVRDGEVELYPQTRRAERLPLGRNMPLLDPESLRPLDYAAIGEQFDPDLLRQALEELEEWYARPCDSLLARLRSLPQLPPPTAPSHLARRGVARGSVSVARSDSSPSPDVQALLDKGLSRPSSRFDAEWKVATAFVMNPAAYPQYRLTDHPTDSELATALALWLSEKNNGYSAEWIETVQKLGNEGAVEYWKDRYLRRGAQGDHMIDRIVAYAAKLDPSRGYVVALSEYESCEILELAERHYPRGSTRHRFECWWFEGARRVKDIIRFHERRGDPVMSWTDPAGWQWARVEISASWMRDWPFGGGSSSVTKESRYKEFRRLLEHTRILERDSRYISPTYGRATAGEDLAGQAYQYIVLYPDFSVRAGDVEVPPYVLSPAIKELTGFGSRRLTLGEAYHALFVTAAGINLRRRYTPHIGRQVEALAKTVRDAIARDSSSTHGEESDPGTTP